MSRLLLRGLSLVERERPEVYAAMAACLEGLSLEVDVDARVVLGSHGGEIREVARAEGGGIRVRAGRDAVRALLHGEVTLLGAIRSGEVELSGPVEALGRGFGAFEYFVGALLTIDEAEELSWEMER